MQTSCILSALLYYGWLGSTEGQLSYSLTALCGTVVLQLSKGVGWLRGTVVRQLSDEIEWLKDKKTAPKPREVKEADFSRINTYTPTLHSFYSVIPPEYPSCIFACYTYNKIYIAYRHNIRTYQSLTTPSTLDTKLTIERERSPTDTASLMRIKEQASPSLEYHSVHCTR